MWLTDEQIERVAEDAIKLGSVLDKLPTVALRWKKPDGSFGCCPDMYAESRLFDSIRQHWPKMGVLSEESRANIPREETFVSLDGLDGTVWYLKKRIPKWSTLISVISKRGPMQEPVVSIVTQAALHRAFITRCDAGVKYLDYNTGSWMPYKRPPAKATPTIGSDAGPASPKWYRGQVSRVADRFRARIECMPAGHAALEVLTGGILCWWSYTTHIWDDAATELMLRESGCVAECLDGNPMPWDCIKMPPIILARSRETADIVRKVLGMR